MSQEHERPTTLGIRWVEGNCPGLVEEIVRWHGLYYVRDLGWAPVFGVLCDEQLAEIARHFGVRDDVAVFSAWRGDEFLASAVMDARDGNANGAGSTANVSAATGRAGARLRFFIASDVARGQGVGGQLLARAIAWSERRGDPAVWLTTVAGLAASSHLYRKFGFSIVDEHVDTTWGSEHREQVWVRRRREFAESPLR